MEESVNVQQEETPGQDDVQAAGQSAGEEAGQAAGQAAAERPGERTPVQKNSSRFFCNRDCEYLPCHEGLPNEEFNCLFCYCPLYAFGEKCGGNFRILQNGVKDCTFCTMPHHAENYDLILQRLGELSAPKDR